VYYEDITAGKDGRFSAFVLVHKPSYTVDVTVTGTVNIVGGVGGVTVSKTASGSDTTVTFSGELANTNIKGEVTSIIDPSNVTEDWVIGIFPFVGGITAVGGIAVPVDKLGLLAPYIGFASTIAIAGVATAVYVKRVKHKKEKQ
jgi:hypothetical protein